MKYNVIITYEQKVVGKNEVEAIQKMKDYIEKKQVPVSTVIVDKENDNGKV